MKVPFPATVSHGQSQVYGTVKVTRGVNRRHLGEEVTVRWSVASFGLEAAWREEEEEVMCPAAIVGSSPPSISEIRDVFHMH